MKVDIGLLWLQAKIGQCPWKIGIKKQVHFPWEPVRKNYTSQFCFSHSKICFQLLTSRNGKINVHCSKPQVGNHLRKLIDKLVTKILLESQWLDWKEYKMRILIFFSCLFVYFSTQMIGSWIFEEFYLLAGLEAKRPKVNSTTYLITESLS